MKPIIFSVLFVLLTLGADAQLSVRPSVGVNSATLTREFEDTNWQSQLGYQFGVDLQLGDRIYFQPGLHWELIRQDFNPNDPIPGFNSDFKASHVRIPLMLGFRALEGGGLINFRLYTGPDIAFSVSNSEHSFLGVELNSDTYKRLHWSWNGGVGFDILFFFVDAGYKFGLSDYFQGSVDNGSRTNVFFANAGIRLGL